MTVTSACATQSKNPTTLGRPEVTPNSWRTGNSWSGGTPCCRVGRKMSSSSRCRYALPGSQSFSVGERTLSLSNSVRIESVRIEPLRKIGGTELAELVDCRTMFGVRNRHSSSELLSPPDESAHPPALSARYMPYNSTGWSVQTYSSGAAVVEPISYLVRRVDARRRSHGHP